MAPQHVGYIEDRWPTVRAGVENRKHPLEVAIQVNRRNCLAAELQEIVARVPPLMTRACGKDCGPPGWHYDLPFPDLGAECSGFHLAFLPLMEMHVERRARRQTSERSNFKGACTDWTSNTQNNRPNCLIIKGLTLNLCASRFGPVIFSNTEVIHRDV